MAILLAVVLFSACLSGCALFVNETESTPVPTVEPKDREKRTVAGEKTPLENQTLKLSVATFSSLNPLDTDNRDVVSYMSLVCEPLYTLDDMQKATECLAKSSRHDSEFKIFEITIDTDIKFSDGTTFTAEDVKATCEFIAVSSGFYTQCLQNVAGTFAMSESVVQFVLYEPDAAFLQKLTFPIISKACFKTDAETGNLISTGDIIGTGKYKISAINSEKITLVRNENYRAAFENNYITGVEISRFATENEKILSDYDLGFVYQNTISAGILDGTKTVYSFIGDTFVFMAANCNSTYSLTETETVNKVTETKYLALENPLRIKEIRQAIFEAIDAETLAKAINATASYMPGYSGVADRTETLSASGGSTSRAEKILKAAGYTKNADGLLESEKGVVAEIRILTIDKNTIMMNVSRYISGVLENLGFSVIIDEVTLDEYQEKLETGSYVLAIAEAKLYTNATLAEFFETDGTLNLGGYSNKDVDEYFEELATTEAAATRGAVLASIENIVLDEFPIFGIGILNAAAVTSERVDGISAEELNIFNLAEVFDNIYIGEIEEIGE